METTYKINAGKKEIVGQSSKQYYCLAIETRLINSNDNLEDIANEYIKPVMQENDIIFISEKMVACTQSRAIPVKDIKVGFWADFLSSFVTKNPGGIGLRQPESMQCAINECSLPRILLASAFGAMGKFLGIKGLFYLVAGRKAASIDSPCQWTIQPYDKCVILAPEHPDKAAKQISEIIGGNTVLIVDINDFGTNILGSSKSKRDGKKYLPLLAQNPLGQKSESTPIGILRPI